MPTPMPVYVLITPARNEEDLIEKTILSVISQTVRPAKWIIVSDGSIDKTDEIVNRYVELHDWMEFVRMPEHRERHFAAKVQSFDAGLEKLRDVSYGIIGNIDADISFEADYMEFLLSKFVNDVQLGVAGTPFIEDGFSYDFRFASSEHVSGACQLFRKQCFEAVGGYIPIKGGAIDWVAVTTARMKGWKTQTFFGKTYTHHRPSGSGSGGMLKSRFYQGKKDYYVGGHPLWQVLRSCFQMMQRPYFVGGVFLLTGYLWSFVTGVKSPVSTELRSFHRKEQMDRLRLMLRRGARRV